MANNPYFNAVEARTPEEAEDHFQNLIQGVRLEDPKLDYDGACERVVSSLMWCSGYIDEDTRSRVSSLYSHYSPYRR